MLSRIRPPRMALNGVLPKIPSRRKPAPRIIDPIRTIGFILRSYLTIEPMKRPVMRIWARGSKGLDS